MSGAYLATNLIDGDAVLLPSSEDAAYPVENIFDREVANVFRGTSTSALSISIEFTGSKSPDTIAILNHNFTSGVTIELYNGDTSPPTLITAIPYRLNDIWKAISGVSAQILILDISDSNADELQVGQIVIGNRVALPARRIGSAFRPAIDRRIIRGETYGGVIYSYHLFERREFNPQFRLTESQFDIIETLDATVFGSLYPFVYIPDSSLTPCYYVRKEDAFEPVEVELSVGPDIIRDYQMILAEESRGLDLQA